MNLRKILALDLGQHTGWAAIDAEGKIVCGTKNFERAKFERTGQVWLRFANWLEEIIRATGCQAIVFEDVKAHNGTMAGHWYGGFWAHLTAAAERHSVPCAGVGVTTIKQAACGTGAAGKDDVVRAMVALGHNPKNNNESDALAILHWAMANYKF